ncbi:MAG: hypothetical protein AB8B61_01435 [Cyclobacteriaceae bacterium]
MKNTLIFLSFVLITQISYAKFPKKAFREAKVYRNELSLSKKQTHDIVKIATRRIKTVRKLHPLRASNASEFKTKENNTRKIFEGDLLTIFTTEQKKYYTSHRSEIRDRLREAKLYH